jgi:hypothetical protein
LAGIAVNTMSKEASEEAMKNELFKIYEFRKRDAS